MAKLDYLPKAAGRLSVPNKFHVASMIILLAVMACFNCYALSIEDAYKTIPHRRTVFDPAQAKMTKHEKEYLSELFALVDLATIERVEMMGWMMSRGKVGRLAVNYDEIFESYRKLKIPVKLMDVHNLVFTAIEGQHDFLNTWNRRGFNHKFDITDDPKVKESSGKLVRAYNFLMKIYPLESEHNKNAFYDYLCALDFK